MYTHSQYVAAVERCMVCRVQGVHGASFVKLVIPSIVTKVDIRQFLDAGEYTIDGARHTTSGGPMPEDD